MEPQEKEAQQITVPLDLFNEMYNVILQLPVKDMYNLVTKIQQT